MSGATTHLIILPHLFRQFMHLPAGIQGLWLHGELHSASEILSRDIVLNGKSSHAHANRALVQARLKNWSNALADAEMVTSLAFSQYVTLKDIHCQSIDARLSVIGCIAKSIALCGQHKHEDAMQAFDLAFGCCGAEQVNYLLLVKVCMVYRSCSDDLQFRFRQSSCSLLGTIATLLVVWLT